MKIDLYISRLKHVQSLLLVFLVFMTASANATSYVWNGSVSTQWGEANNWTPAGIPDLGDDVTISNQSNNPVFEEISGLNNFTMNSGSLDLSAFTLVIYGTATFNGGTLSNGNIAFISGSSSTFAGSTFSCGLSGTLSDVYFNGSTFNNAVSITRNSASDNSSNGGNTFNSTFSLTNTGTGNITLSNVSADTYADNVTFSTSASGLILAANSATGNSFGGNLTFNSSGTSLGIRLGQNGGTSTLSSGKTLAIGSFTVGDLRLKGLTQSGATAQTLTLTGTSALYLESGCTFNAAVTFSAPQVYLNGSTYAGTTSITKSGAGNNQSLGGNTFNGATTIRGTGSGDFILGVSNPDAFASTSTFTNTGSGTLFIAHVASGTTLAGNVQVNSTGSSKGVRFGQSGGTVSLASSKTLTVGASGFTAGSLRLRGFTQTGSTAQTLNIASGTAALYLETGTTFNAACTFTFPQVFLSGVTFASSATITKGGATDNTGAGGCTFSSTTRISNTGSGRLILGGTNPDIFNGNLSVECSGSSTIQLAQTASGSQFNGDLVVNSINSSLGIKLGQNGGTSTLADGKTISIGGSGFNVGDLTLRGFTQAGSTAQSLVEFADAASITLETGNTFNGDVVIAAPSIYLNGTSFNGTASITKNGPLSENSEGGNTFASTVSIVNVGDGEMLLGNTNPDVFNNDLTLENSGIGLINLAYGSSGNTFNGNIELNCVGGGSGIRFGQNGGSSTLASGKTINIGSSGFTSGDLRLAHFVQLGSTSQSLTTFGSDVELYLSEGSEFNGNATFTCDNVYLDGTTFNSNATISKTGAGYNLSNGGNVFNGTTTISNSGTGTFILAGSAGDTFNENVTFSQSTAFTLFPAYNVNCSFKKNISTEGSATSVVFASNGGRATLDGAGAQFINGDAAKLPEFYNLTINKSAGSASLGVTTLISNNLTLTSGNLVSSSTNLLKLLDNSTVTGVSNSSYVAGPVRKEGNDAFTFPVGKSGYYRPIGISAPSSTGDHFTAEFYMSDSDGSYSHASKDVSIDHLSHCEYWILNRTNGSSAVSVTMSWNAPSCGVTALGDLRVARWNGSMWKDHGNGGTTGNTTVGTIISSGSISNFSPFTLGSTSSENPLPVHLVHFGATPVNNEVALDWTTVSESNNNYFSIESSPDAVNFTEIGRVSGAGNSNTTLNYRSVDPRPHAGVSYYRLKQVDFDGKFMYSNIEVVSMSTLWDSDIVLSPNPVLSSVDIRLDPDDFHNPSIEIRDMQGRLLLVKDGITVDPQKPVRIDLSEFPHGLYFLQVSEGGHSVSKRVIKE
ncbi:MAG: hypothetical protein RLZZ543_1468 [Bacteroidota bacterium]|jgi:hypothetical protein